MGQGNVTQGLIPDMGQMIVVPTRIGSQTSQFFQSQGSVINTKAMGRRAFEVRQVPRPENVTARLRYMEKEYKYIDEALANFLRAPEPSMYTAELVAALDRAGGTFSTDALVARCMSAYTGSAYKVAEVMDVSRNMPKGNYGIQMPSADQINSKGSKLGVYYHQDQLTFRSPGELVLRWWVVFEIAERLATKDGKYGHLLAQLIKELHAMVRQKVYNLEANDIGSSPEFQVLAGLNAFIYGVRRLPDIKKALQATPSWEFMNGFGSPIAGQTKADVFGEDMGRLFDRALGRIDKLSNWTPRKVKSTIEDMSSPAVAPPTTPGQPIVFGESAVDLWGPGLIAMEMTKLLAGLDMFLNALPQLGKIRVQLGARIKDYERALDHMKVLRTLIAALPEVNNLTWAYDTSNVRVRSPFASWEFETIGYRVKYGIVDPLATLGDMTVRYGFTESHNEPLPGMELLRDLVLFSYEPVDITMRDKSSDWWMDVPLDHTALEVPVIYWSTDQENWDMLQEWCSNQTNRVLRPQMLPTNVKFPGCPDIKSVFPVYPAILEGAVRASNIHSDRLFALDAENTIFEATGRLCVPDDTSRIMALLGLDKYQLPDYHTLALNERTEPVTGPLSNWNPSV